VIWDSGEEARPTLSALTMVVAIPARDEAAGIEHCATAIDC
jgi:hypothetical protein